MLDGQETSLPISVEGISNDATADPAPQQSMFKHWQWWLIIALNIIFLLAGQTAAVLLGRLYYEQGGNSKWMATLVHAVAFPLLFITYIFYAPSPSTVPRPPISKMSIIYVVLGLIITADDLMYSYGLLYLPTSTCSLVCATQLAFNAVFSYFLNSQKMTPMIFNSVVLITFSVVLLGIDSEPDDSSTDIPKGKYLLGFMLTLGSSAAYSLVLSLMQVTFEKVLKRETFAVVLEMEICTSIVATLAAVVGLFVSGEWKELRGEMERYPKGKMSYVMTLVWTALAWQVSSVGVVGLIFVVSSLFSNLISTLALPVVVPIFVVIVFHDKMGGVKIMALLIALWGFASYMYQQYLDDSKTKKTTSEAKDSSEDYVRRCETLH